MRGAIELEMGHRIPVGAWYLEAARELNEQVRIDRVLADGQFVDPGPPYIARDRDGVLQGRHENPIAVPQSLSAWRSRLGQHRIEIEVNGLRATDERDIAQAAGLGDAAR